ncbi:hypothetical protein L2X99_02710 [Microbacterium sp. KUDC0406]|uniref:hypothetical protein n=1 Tax=Microbacterium sp. KUDC0406 TaxID=2909588 RepID=UPI001F2E5AF5|nr:hypothetical protein [Microbacterium sp. KUDC0406]UJP10606.1 hypothetical protein L2X99_02710 [Microbacterium sp. KUDC0406]
MRLTVRSMATGLALGFAVYFAARGVWWTPVQPEVPLFMVAAIGLYIATILTAVLAGTDRQVRMPLWCGILAVVTAVAVPYLVSVSLIDVDRVAPFATWYIGATGLLGVVCIVRRRFLIGWLILLILGVSACAYMGPGNAFTLGLVGSITWVTVAQLLVLFWDRAVRDTERLADIQQAVSAWHATQQVRQRERRMRVQLALAVAGPLLARTVAAHGALDADEKKRARIAEGRLRDELRGASLLNDAVREAIADARSRGVAVTVFDEGGLDNVGEQRRDEIRDELAGVLAQVSTDRVIIRAGSDEVIAVTVVGRGGAGGSRDEDEVDLWHEIPREAPKH